MRQKFILTPFAAVGDRESPPDAQQPDGSVSYSQGFGPDYSADPATSPTAKLVPREETNGIYYDLTDGLRALQTRSVPEFITSADNGGSPFPYDRGTAVAWSASGDPPFTTYVSRVNGNTAVPSNATNWSPLLFEGATNAEALAGSSSALIITPAALQYVLSQTAVSVPPATTTAAGTTRYATNAEAQSGSPAAAAVTPPALQSALGAYGFNASQVTGGTLAVARIPSLPASQIGSGTLSVERGGTGGASWSAGSYLRGAGTGALEARSGSQVLSDIGAVNRNGDTIPGALTLPAVSLAVPAPTGYAAFNFPNQASVFQAGSADTFYGNWAVGFGATANHEVFLLQNNSKRIRCTTDGNVTVVGALSATGGFQGSSRTVKHSERQVAGSDALAIVAALPAWTYEHKPEYRDDEGRRSFGFFAEDLAELLPEVVRATPDGPSPLVVEHSQLTAVLWAAVQHLACRVKELEDRIDG